MGDETRIYHGRWRNGVVQGGDYFAEVGLATLPRDRRGALGLFPGKEEGSVWSVAIRLPKRGARMHLNADHAAGISVEIADEKFRLLPGFSGDRRGRAGGADGLEVPLRWGGRSLTALGERTVRFRFHFQSKDGTSPRLFAVYLNAADWSFPLRPELPVVYHPPHKPNRHCQCRTCSGRRY